MCSDVTSLPAWHRVFRVTAPNEAHGIYLRDGVDVRGRIVERAVSVKTQFANQDAAGQLALRGRPGRVFFSNYMWPTAGNIIGNNGMTRPIAPRDQR